MACKDCKYFQEFRDTKLHSEGFCSLNNYGVSASYDCESFEPIPARAVKPKNKTVSKQPIRKGMNVISVIGFVFAVIYLIIGFVGEPASISAALFFLDLGVMFAVLARSPKYIPYILGRDRGLKKWQFVVICIVVCYVIVGASSAVALSSESV